MADTYRKSSLEKISSPEQLDKVLRVTSPLSWLPLLGLTVIVVVTVIWSIVGTIPVTITSRGIVSSQLGSNAVYSQEQGKVVSVRVREGEELHLGMPVMTYKTSGNEMKTICSDQVGRVSGLDVKKDDVLTPGQSVIRVTPTSSGQQIVVCYVPLAQAKKLERGMQVNITLDSLESRSYGKMVGRIVNIDAYACSSKGMTAVLGSDNFLEGTFTKDGPVVAVACELYPDANTVSGYYWSNAKGREVGVSNGSLVTAKIVTEKIAPITKLFTKLAEVWG